MALFAPLATSSAGWNRKRTVPQRSSFIPLSTVAAPSSMAPWVSCPQACMTPGFSEANSTPLFSVMLRASMSARRTMILPGFPPLSSARRPVGSRRR